MGTRNLVVAEAVANAQFLSGEFSVYSSDRSTPVYDALVVDQAMSRAFTALGLPTDVAASNLEAFQDFLAEENTARQSVGGVEAGPLKPQSRFRKALRSFWASVKEVYWS